MPKPLVALLAVPVLLWVVATGLLRRSLIARGGLTLALGALVAVAALTFVRPMSTTATPPSPIVPVPQAAFQTVVTTGVDVDEPAVIRFSTPMDPASVEAATTLEPATLVTYEWDATRTELRVLPVLRWQTSTYHTVTVGPGALAASGRPMTRPARAAFVTRMPAGTGIAATSTIDKRIATDTAFRITFERPVTQASLDAAVILSPAADGLLARDAAIDGLETYRFTPTAPLKAGTWYRLTVAGVIDELGAPVEATSRAFRTVEAPSVVRFRPRPFTKDIDRGAAISVRFSQSMDRATTKAAFSASIDGDAITGTVSFAEDDTVLVFRPARALPWDRRVDVRIAATATSALGVPLAREASSAFRTEAKPAPAPVAAPSSSGSSGGSTGGGSVGSGSWTAVERYYLGLMNCTRTGGIVTSSGSCSSPGGRDVAALKLDSGISSKVSRPYAKRLATGNLCSHFIGGGPGDRLRAAGYTNYTWAENLGCRSGDPYAAVLGSHLFFQSERSWSPLGGHYVNLMNRAYDRVGIGVWVSSGRVRLVVDFYRP
ncbi:MAG: Ig-like domain-containing protein [Candidatus Limnocylindria bacterium]